MEGLNVEHREVLLTTVSDAKPDVREGSPEPSVWPLVTAIAVTALFIGSIFDEWLIVWLSIPVTLALIGWFWPKPSHSAKVAAPEEAPPPGALA
jgi:cytochrome c oxidase subunit 1